MDNVFRTPSKDTKKAFDEGKIAGMKEMYEFAKRYCGLDTLRAMKDNIDSCGA